MHGEKDFGERMNGGQRQEFCFFPPYSRSQKPDGIYDMCMTAKLKIMKGMVRHFRRTGAAQGLVPHLHCIKIHAYQVVPSTNEHHNKNWQQ